jgi:uncharacterized protein YyaL (SSP411 family)
MPSNPESFNHLIGEKSPYLLQHAHNPVQWYPWGEAAFNKAKQEDKPILLSIGYSTCHWCHVMAHESFEDEGIAKIINDHFIAIKVDREERPDIDHIYMSAVTSMTGQGGWPLTAFLTPQADAFYGGTYFPPYAKWGSVGFIDLLNSIAAGWASDRNNILESSLSITENLRKSNDRHQAAGSNSSDEMDKTFLDRAYRQMTGQFDGDNGGFGSSPKFPMGHTLSFLLRYYKQTGNRDALGMVEKTLTKMFQGGIKDHLAGGFHRYSTDAYWHVPHFEKMLYDQALLSRAFLETYQVTGSIVYAQNAREILDYVIKQMTDPLGGFYSAEDADSLDAAEGHIKEGAFYVFSHKEITDALGPDHAAVFNYCYGVMPQGNVNTDPHGEFIGKNVLYQAHSMEEAATHFLRQKEEIQGILKASSSLLLNLRSQRAQPYLDNKVLTDWNGLMMASFAFASRVLEEKKYIQAATKAADFILEQMKAKDRLLHRWREGEAGIEATLDDYAYFIYGLLEVYEASFQDQYLEAAKKLADAMIDHFSDQSGGFYMTANDAERLIIRPKEVYDGALPSGNSVAALILLKLYALTKREAYRTHIEPLFACFVPAVVQAPYAHTFLLSALDWHLHAPMEISFEGEQDDVTIAKMLKILYKYYIPSKVVKFVPASGRSLVYLCFQGTCQPPIDSTDVFEQKILSRS